MCPEKAEHSRDAGGGAAGRRRGVGVSEKAEPSRGAGGGAAGRRGLGVSEKGGAFPRCGRQSRRENTNQVVG